MISGNKLGCFAAISLALLVVVSGQGRNGSLSICPSGYSQLENKCVQVVHSMLNWYQAERKCRTMGANLLTVTGEQELEALNAWLPQAMPNQLQLWTSGTDLGQNGTFYWQSSGEAITYLPWATGTIPNMMSGGHCLTLYGIYTRSQGNVPNVGYKLLRQECDFINRFVCEVPQQENGTRSC